MSKPAWAQIDTWYRVTADGSAYCEGDEYGQWEYAGKLPTPHDVATIILGVMLPGMPMREENILDILRIGRLSTESAYCERVLYALGTAFGFQLDFETPENDEIGYQCCFRY